MVDAHEACQQVDVFPVELREKLRTAYEAEYLIRKCRAIAQVLEAREQLAIGPAIRVIRHAGSVCALNRAGYCSASIGLMRRLRTPSASVSSSFALSSQPMHPSVMLCP